MRLKLGVCIPTYVHNFQFVNSLKLLIIVRGSKWELNVSENDKFSLSSRKKIETNGRESLTVASRLTRNVFSLLPSVEHASKWQKKKILSDGRKQKMFDAPGNEM